MILAAVSGAALLVGGAGTAQAGGVNLAECPSGQRADISSAYSDFIDTNPELALHSLTRLDHGYYSVSGRYWPPSTIVTCGTVPQWGKPLVEFRFDRCPPSWLGYAIPESDGPGTTVEWGTYLPAGFYTLGRSAADAQPDPGWVAVCQAPLDVVAPLVAATPSSPTSP
jgi:hypothetical protein